MKGFVGNKPQIQFVLSQREHFFPAPSQQGIRVCKLYGLLRDGKLLKGKPKCPCSAEQRRAQAHT